MPSTEYGGTGHIIGRRRFMQLLAAAGATGLVTSQARIIRRALSNTDLKLIWLQASSCNGCTGSLLNATLPDLPELLSGMGVDITMLGVLEPNRMGLRVDNYLIGNSATNPLVELKELLEGAQQGTERYVLVVEGAVPRGPQGSGRYHLFDGEPMVDAVLRFAQFAVGTIAFGTCACFGGIHASFGSLAEMRGLKSTYRGDNRLNDGVLAGGSQVINISGCPPHPDWLTIVLLAINEGWEIPQLDTTLRPREIYPSDFTLHDLCELRHHYDHGEFAYGIGEQGCLYKLGCKGLFTRADCPTRRWNESTEFCVSAGGPCIACTEPGFPDVSSPFYTQKEDSNIFAGLSLEEMATAAGAATGVLIGLHTIRRVIARDREDEDENRP